jgi:hypothetical protein
MTMNQTTPTAGVTTATFDGDEILLPPIDEEALSEERIEVCPQIEESIKLGVGDVIDRSRTSHLVMDIYDHAVITYIHSEGGFEYQSYPREFVREDLRPNSESGYEVLHDPLGLRNA